MNIVLTDLYGKKLALLLWFLNEEMETSHVVVTGTGFMHDGHLSLHRGSILPPVRIPLALVWRAQEVPEQARTILNGADYVIRASVAELGASNLTEGFSDSDRRSA